ncbi:SPRY domain-containing protein 3 [Ilyodon furcidens]|uniref:SPRY domain-containing protein 3 n=1 Tax=Ilyodon furcidens TaxID=33524 RepID=A0ABV0UBV3_9TELE
MSLSDDGKIFHGSGVGDAFGPRCFKGDIMGCGIMFPRDYSLDGEGSADVEDCDQLEGHPSQEGVQNVLYLNDEEEEEEEEGEEIAQEQQGRKVTVSYFQISLHDIRIIGY